MVLRFRFPERKAPLCPPTKEEAEIYWDRIGQHIVPILDFMKSTALIVSVIFPFRRAARVVAEACACVNGVCSLVGKSTRASSSWVQKHSVKRIRNRAQMGVRYFQTVALII